VSTHHCTVGNPSPTTADAVTLLVAAPKSRPRFVLSPSHYQDAEPSRVCGNCLATYWPNDAEFEGVRLVAGLCPICSESYLAGRWE
jgi:hypothetical protein